ncbi:uncharacterized protein LOC119677688 [Teleopsis dalmanni]|uniref:uncharacterized protein LOC119677685 n=1 Tax=Teleopsis dalmanni TaxID=139649 RepID=UPI0018CDA3E5|nr:uncharacterized protein LOC119677685 [Teleopsis dalmanni]XP_037945066.1 uncharacterized protein LOC119677688 [Teleopsis dalmanni]
MRSLSFFAVICFLVVINYTYAAPIELFPGFLRNININTPDKTDDIVKRRVYEENPDAELKQISLQSLIGDLEDSLFQSALSVSSFAGSDDAAVEEVTPKSDEHTVNKRSTDDKPVDADKPTTPIPQDIAVAKSLASDEIIPILQHTQKVPEKEGVPAHIIIDRISIQPHHGSLPLIPAFQVQHTKVKAAAITEDGSKVENVKVTKISFSDASALTSTTEKSVEISQNAETTSKPAVTSDTTPKVIVTSTGGITGTVTTQHVESTVLLAVSTTPTPTPAINGDEKIASSPASDINTSTSVVTAISSSAPTQAPIKELKEAEKELKEKVAEIEAEPVILSSRV